jgi:serine protease Do
MNTFLINSAFKLLAAAIVLAYSATSSTAEEPTANPISKDSLSAKLESTPPGLGFQTPATIADVKELEKRIQKVVEAVSPSVVAIGAGGSGVVVSRDGFVLCVAHVGERAGRNIAVTFPDGRKARGVTLGNCGDLDAGLMKITDPGPWPHVDMALSKELNKGQGCLALSYPVTFEHGKSPAVRIGRVLRNEAEVVVTDCTIMGGDSGGPLFDLQGKVVGISSTCDNSLQQNRHVPVDCFRKYWDRLAKGEDFKSRNMVALLGLHPDTQTKEARLCSIDAGSPAEKADLKTGDTILKFDGKPVHAYIDLESLAMRHHPGCTCDIAIEVQRGQEVITVHTSYAKTGAERASE